MFWLWLNREERKTDALSLPLSRSSTRRSGLCTPVGSSGEALSEAASTPDLCPQRFWKA